MDKAASRNLLEYVVFGSFFVFLFIHDDEKAV
jgi:hypothetical protein